MEASDSTAKLCEVCSNLNIQWLTHPLFPCRNPLPCSTAPIERAYGTFFALGSIEEIKSRRFTCDICKLISESLDKEPPDLDGKCDVKESAEFCNFKLPEYIKARDPSTVHFHLTQLSVIFQPSVENEFQGPSLPWEARDTPSRSTRYILNLQVKARSCAEAGDPTAASPRTEQEFLDTIGGRHVGTQVNVQLIRAWLHRCESEHGKDCMPSLRLLGERDGGSTFQPTFVVDVIQSCLVDTPSECRYVALSYVWGTARVFTHLQENTQDLRRSSSLHSLPIPATIRDAMTLVHAIGERYLWVDSLCIIQNDSQMKQAEISRMGSIYSKALFTIIAAAGDHANSGLPGVEWGSREQVQKILKLANSELLTVIDIRKTPSGIDETIWASRAWTFQERVLSNRVLVFSESQVYWSCRAASHSEEHALEEVRDIRRLHKPFPETQSATGYLPRDVLQPLEYRYAYRDLLSSYRQRHLTYQTDMLNAFNGVSEILAALQNDTFFWGLPESLFTYAMTWFLTTHSSRNYVEVPVINRKGSKEMIPIPSWSWVAWSGEQPHYVLFSGDRHYGVRPVVHFNIVDGEHQLVRIKEKSYQDHPDDRIRALRENEQLHHWQLQSPTQHSPFRIGQLHFWTSLANVTAIRLRRHQGLGVAQYTLFPSPNFQPDPKSTDNNLEIVHQDFIVIAARSNKTPILLAVEWRDGVAYRLGQAEVKEEDWARVENKRWQLITLG